MTGGAKLLFIVFLAVFIMILSTALFSEVSLSASLVRAGTAATVFTVMLWGTFKIMSCFILSDIKAVDEAAATDDIIGRTLNITVADDLSNEQILKDNSQDIANNSAIAPQSSRDPESSFDEFSPLAAQQIDPQIEKIINNDPKRLAEIVKKMGFDD